MKLQSKPADNKKKLLVVVLLGLLLVVVLFQSFSSQSSSDSNATQSPTATTVAAPTGPLTGPAALAALQERLPKVDLNQVLAHDPFQLLVTTTVADSSDSDYLAAGPANSENSANGAQPAQPATLQVSAILHGGSRPAVLIGQRLYYEHDQIEGGWRILAIHPDRVSVERLDDAP
ncbi:MAG: hypothetical protein JNL67_00095 [Planctomycetaceae bacterium]|nr:hypothetical protein [Planctomycetaceae bacterium]